MRAIVSVSRTRARSRTPTICRSLSPTGWPSVSLTCLKWSRSRMCMATISPRVRTRQRLLQPLIQQRAIGQRGQRIVQRHVRDLGLRATLLSDVLVRGDYAAIDHRLYRDRNVAPVGQLADVATCLPACGTNEHGVEHVVDGIGTAITVGNAMLDDLAHMHAGHHLRGLEAVDLRITLVGDNQA